MSTSLTCLFLFLQSLPILCKVDIFHCPLFQKASVYRNGDLVLDGFFTLHSVNVPPQIEHLSFLQEPNGISSRKWHWNDYQYVLAFLFAIEEINKNSNMLPNMTLGFNIYSSFDSDHKTLENILFWLSGGNQITPNYNCQRKIKSVAIITGTISQFILQNEPLLELYKVPQITCGTFDPLLTDKHQFPSLYQMMTEDNSLVRGVVWLLQHFKWTWVGIFVSQGIISEQFLWELEAEMLKKGICVYNIIKLSSAWVRDTDFVVEPPNCKRISEPNVSVVYGDDDIFMKLHRHTLLCVLSGMMWIFVSKSYADLNRMKSVVDLYYGSLSFSYQKWEVPGFQHFLKTVNPSKYPEDFYLTKFWLDIFDCSFSVSLCGKFRDCPTNSSLEFMPGNIDMLMLSEPSYFLYNAVHAVARALHEMLLGKGGTDLIRDSNQLLLLPWKLHPFLRSIQFTNSIGDHISLSDKRNLKKQYDILNIVSFPAVHDFLAKVGEFVSNGPNNQSFDINEDLIEWPAEFKKPPKSMCSESCGPGFKQVKYGNVICCFVCIFCSDGEISNKTDAQDCILCSTHEYSNQERSDCIPKSVTFLAFEDSLGMTLVFTALFFSIFTIVVLWVILKHRDTPIVKANNRTLSYTLLISLLLCFLCSLLFIGHPNIVTCILQQVTFGVVFTVAVSSVLAKTITVILAFRATKPGRTVRWLLVSGASNSVVPICTLIPVVICGVWLGTSPPFIDIDSHSDPTQLILMCNKGSITAFYCVLGYLGSLALLSFCLSYQVRNLPDTFNEAKFLTFSMLVFCSIWVTFLPVYHSARGKVMVALEVFSILASSAGLLVCIFAPKCYIILIRPDMNSLKSLRNKVTTI